MTSALREIGGFIAGAWQTDAAESDTLADKYTGAPLARVARSDRATVAEAVRHLAAARDHGPLSPRERADILLRAAAGVAARSAELVSIVQSDTGFALPDARKEVERTVETLTLSAEEAKRLTGHLVPIEGAPGGEGLLSYTRLDPIGIVCALTPFNSPLNTVAHKIGPAIAAGNSVVLKPASLTPLSAHALVEILLDAGLPPSSIALVYGSGASVGSWLAEERAIGYYAFTGSTEVGRELHRAVGMRRTQLEMGSLASTIVCADADLPAAAEAIVAGALRKSGQVCTSVQRVFVDAAVQEDLADAIARAMEREVAGDPTDPGTTVGPLISAKEADRVRTWIDEAVGAGAVVRGGGAPSRVSDDPIQPDGAVTGTAVVTPTLLTSVPDDARIMRSELFGPAVLLAPFRRLDEAFARVNDTPYGLAAGVFTDSLSTALASADHLRVGAVYVNRTSASRADVMPFGGLKDSGFGGVEGPAYAIRDMSHERTVTIARRH